MGNEITTLGYVGIGAPEPRAWEAYASKVMGMGVEPGIGESIRLRLDDRVQRLTVERGRPGLAYLGWEVREADDLQAVSDRLADHGVNVRAGNEDDAERRGVEALVWCTDPSGNRVEVFTGLAAAGAPLRLERNNAGFVTGDLGMGHVALYVENLERSMAFYTGLLGLQISETIPPLNAAFLRAKRRHHSLALFGIGVAGINHVFVQAADLHDVGRTIDAARQQTVEQPITLGYHPPDGTVSAYFRSPSGFNVEHGWGCRVVDDDWVPGGVTDEAWGHEGLLDDIMAAIPGQVAERH